MKDKAMERVEAIEKEVQAHQTKATFIGKGIWNQMPNHEDSDCYIFDLTGQTSGRLVIISDDGKIIREETTLKIDDANLAINAKEYQQIANIAQDVMQHTPLQ